MKSGELKDTREKQHFKRASKIKEANEMKRIILFVCIVLLMTISMPILKAEMLRQNLNEDKTIVQNNEKETEEKNNQITTAKANAKTDETVKSQDKKELKAQLFLVHDTSIKIDKKDPILPIWVGVKNIEARSVKVKITKIVSEQGKITSFERLKIEPTVCDIIYPKGEEVFNAKFDDSEIEELAPGLYTADIIITSEKIEQERVKLGFEITPPKSWLSSIPKGITWVREKLILNLWYIFEIILFFLVIVILIWFLRLARKGRYSLNVLPIVNETGMTGEFEGVASGIDDILMVKLQDINYKSCIAAVKHYWLSPAEESAKREAKTETQFQLMNVKSGGIPMELQKVGDISIGKVKIPLGSIVAFLNKILGGNYVSGALQKYGNANKIVLRLEKRRSIMDIMRLKKRPYFLRSEVHYFETTWLSENIESESLSKGVPAAVEELAYRIILNLAAEVATQNWIAYKYFIEGLLAFRDYEENRTRIDRLRDSISRWRESVRLDPNFAKAHFNLGVALDMEGKYEDAIFRYNKIIQMSPELVGAEAHYNLARIYWDIYKDEYQTLEELKKAKARDSNLSDIYNLEGLVYYHKKEDEKAASMYEEANKLSGETLSSVYYTNLSIAKYHLKEYDAAQKAGKTALENYREKERSRVILETMGWIHNKKGALESKEGHSVKAIDEYKKAINYFEEGSKKEPENKSVLHGYGEALRESGKLHEALIVQRSLIRLWPEYADGYSELAKTLKALKRPDDEINAFEKVGKIHQPFNIIALPKIVDYLNLKNATSQQKKIYAGALGGIIYYLAPKKEDALDFFKEIFKPELLGVKYILEPEALHTYGLTLMILQDYEEASKYLAKAISLYQSDQYYDLAKCYFDLADTYCKIQKHNEADKAYREAINLFIKIKQFQIASDIYVESAKCLIGSYRRGDCSSCYDWALDECKKAIRLDESNYNAFHVNGNIYYGLFYYNEAIPLYEKAIEINYNLTGAHYNLGLCYMNMRQYAKAAKKFETVIKLKKEYAAPYSMKDPDAYTQLSFCLEKMGKLERAADILREAVNTFPSSPKYHILLGQLLGKCNLLDEACREYKRALEVDKKNKVGLTHLALNHLANLYADQGADLDNAYRMILKAKRLVASKKSKTKKDPSPAEEELAQIENTFGWIYYQKNQTENAVKYLEKSLAYSLEDPKSHARLALAYEKHASTCSDDLAKADYLEKAKAQWRIVLDLDVQNRWRKIAEEHLSLKPVSSS